jgi:sterol desaturase/sphingolipid hydroxylase (fatty acid hydroxylase superfamily)
MPHGVHLAQRLFITPALHRAHHASDWRDPDTNSGTVFSVWDRLAGTFRAREPDRPIVTGLPTWVRPEAPALAESLLLPFARGRSRPR